MRIARESWILGGICLADLVYTVWLLAHGAAVEANPVLAYYLGHGMLAFVAAKLLLIVGPIAGVEWVRRRRPRFVERMLRVGIALYLLCYGLGVWRVNALAQAGTMQVASASRAD